MIVVRYADDLVVGFEHEATHVASLMRCMTAREFALSLHPDKTRLIEFGRFAANDRKLRGLGKPKPSRSWASPSSASISPRQLPASRKTRRDRMRGKLRDIKAELLRRMHQPIPSRGNG